MRSTTLALAGRYRLDERIAAGGVGEVWRGHDTVLARAVAVKLLRPEYAEHRESLVRFRAEARHAAGLSDPGIAQVYDYGEDRQPFLVMELVNGPSLGAVLARGPLDAWHAMDIVAQTAAALAVAHAAGLVHRDIKPANLLIAPGGQVKVTDFGIAYAAGSAPLTSTGALIGTPAYLAPERAAGQPATAASDLYSLGVVCYECLTGAPPFSGTPVEVALAHQRGDLPPLPGWVPADVAALVASLTARDPAARPASAADVARSAARLRDAQRPGAVTGPAGGGGLLPPGLPDALPATLVGSSSQFMAGGLAGSPAAHRRSRRAGLRGRMLLLTVGAAAIVLGLVGWQLADAAGAPHQGPHKSGPASVSSSHALVNEAALVGQPVGVIRAQLRQLGLPVQVVWQHDPHQQPGTVISVQPAGSLPAGTPVTITGASGPPGHSKGGGKQGDGGGHDGGGNGGDGGGGGGG